MIVKVDAQECLIAVVTNDDDMVEFLKSLSLKGAIGFLELSITGVPLLHVVAAGILIVLFFDLFISLTRSVYLSV